jgi:arylsulfatase A-like enzyme
MDTPSKPLNIVIINPDQMRADYMTPAGHPFIGTRHLSHLAGMGVNFEKAFCVSPMCGPSRTSFVTGQYPCEHGVRTYHGTFDPALPSALSVLREAGYRTALHGKDHIMEADAIGVLYDEGEDICLGNADDHPLYRHSWSSAPLEKGSQWDITERLTDAGLAFIERQAQSGQPFYLTLNYQDPHPFFTCPEPYASLFDESQFTLPENYRREPSNGEPKRLSIWREHSESLLATEADFRRAMAMYCGQIRYVDDQVGRVLEALESADLLDSTIVLFWSDHGELLGDYGTTHKLPVYYDSLTRIPAILYDPLNRLDTEAGKHLVESIDLMATVLDLAGLPQPEGSRAISLMDRSQPARQSVFAEAGLYKTPPAEPVPGLKLKAPFAPTEWGPGCMVRTEEWKLCQYAHDRSELYNLLEDPLEATNLYSEGKPCEAQLQLQALLTQRLLCKGADPDVLPRA